MVKAVQPMGIVFASGKTYAVGITDFLLEAALQALRSQGGGSMLQSEQI